MKYVKQVLAFLFDLIGSFLIFGYLVAYLTGGVSEGGFSLQGIGLISAVALVIIYFVAMNKYLGGTLGQKLFKTK